MFVEQGFKFKTAARGDFEVLIVHTTPFSLSAVVLLQRCFNLLSAASYHISTLILVRMSMK